MELKKVQKQGRDERTQEDYPISGVYFCRCRVVFLRSFISALFLNFFQLNPYLKSSLTETFSLVFKCRFLTMEDTLDLLEQLTSLLGNTNSLQVKRRNPVKEIVTLWIRFTSTLQQGHIPPDAPRTKKDNSEEVVKVHG